MTSNLETPMSAKRNSTGSAWTAWLLLVAAASLFDCSGGAANGSRSQTSSNNQVNCATAPVPKFSELTGFSRCTTCHASTRTDEGRMSAPSSVNFDTYDAAKANVASGLSELEGQSMPPSGNPAPSQQEVDAIRRWANCGAPR
jgi:uncharacterized membrane protein